MKFVNAKDMIGITCNAIEKQCEPLLVKIQEEANKGKFELKVQATSLTDEYRSYLNYLGYVIRDQENGSESIIKWML